MDSRKKFYVYSGCAFAVVVLVYLYMARNKVEVDSSSDNSQGAYPTNTAPQMSAAGFPLTVPPSAVGSNVYNINSDFGGMPVAPVISSGSDCGCCDGCNGSGGDNGSPLTSLQNFMQGLNPVIVNQYTTQMPTPVVYLQPAKEVAKTPTMQTVNPFYSNRIGFQAVY